VTHTFHELKEKTIQELRDIAKDVQHEAVQGYSQMNKEHLLPALCKALGIDVHEHYTVSGIDKTAIKARMRELKQKKQVALEAHDHALLRQLRRQIHGLNRQIRAHVSG
jgi:DNA-binding IclR family transcriptional regulator